MTNRSDTGQENTTAHELVLRSLEGDLSAFRSLMESHQHFAYAVAVRLLQDEDNAKDVVQEAFIRVWNNLGRYRPEVKFTTWLYKIVIHLCYDKMKMDSRRKNIFEYIGGFLTGEDLARGGDPLQEIENSDLQTHILAEAKKLPRKEYLVFHLRDVQDFSIQEIAEIVGISAGSVKTNLCYARRRIRTAVMQLQKSDQS
jgi:RNA polymerase sigma-70 factor (ECF subfamily)